ncbi:MAG: XTP/dITP diphosphatase [Firmicutes bacterium]|nr:XTP/dITP diphosphatase [Bacillota bacterium]
MQKNRLVIASQNLNKVKEIKSILVDLNYEVLPAFQVIGTLEIEEDGSTFEENAKKKALLTAKAADCLALADDSGLEVAVLNNQPGVYSARYAGEQATDEDNNQKLLSALADIPEGSRQARFRCVIAIADPQGKVVTCEGICNGRITFKPRGDNGFGYDPLFLVEEYGKTFAELETGIKNKISHRAMALQKAKEILAGDLAKNFLGN